jgi:hypothetical protein
MAMEYKTRCKVLALTQVNHNTTAQRMMLKRTPKSIAKLEIVYAHIIGEKHQPNITMEERLSLL